MSFAPRGIEIFDLCVMLEKQRDSSNKICELQRKGDNAMAERKQTSRVADLLRKSVEAVAEKKQMQIALALCMSQRDQQNLF